MSPDIAGVMHNRGPSGYLSKGMTGMMPSPPPVTTRCFTTYIHYQDDQPGLSSNWYGILQKLEFERVDQVRPSRHKALVP